MKRLIAFAFVGSLLATSVQAQPSREERNVERQRQAVEAWTACIHDEFGDDVRSVLLLDYRTEEYDSLIEDLAGRRVSSECFNAMPRRYRRIQLGGLSFAGGLAERAIESSSEEPLVMRLSMAAIGNEAATFSYTDVIANCTVRGAPHLVAGLFETEVETEEEAAALQQLAPVIDICSRGGSSIEASALGMRSMLATASYRLLAAQNNDTNEGNDDA